MTICWTDLETLGSEPPNNHIIEVGAVMTTDSLEIVGDPFHALVRIPDHVRLWEIDPAVVEMHSRSGLWRALWEGPSLSLSDADVVLNEWIGRTAEGAPRLAGSGVSHFDSNLIRDHLPLSWVLFDGYNAHVKPTLDVGVLRRFLTTFELGNVIPDLARTEVPHRALDDVRRFIEEARVYRDALRGADPLS